MIRTIITRINENFVKNDYKFTNEKVYLKLTKANKIAEILDVKVADDKSVDIAKSKISIPDDYNRENIRDPSNPHFIYYFIK